MGSLAENREEQLAQRELALANARAELRAERELLRNDRAEAKRHLAEAQAADREAKRTRDRTKKLAERFCRRLKHQQAAVTQETEEEARKLAAERQGFATEVAQFDKLRSEFNASAAAIRDRLREAWLGVRVQQKRAAREWIETTRSHAEEEELLKKRSEEITQQEKTLADNRARIEAETAGFREEATSLENRIQNSRTSLAELEQRRDRARSELLGMDVSGELLSSGTAELTQRELIVNREKAGVAALKASLEQEAADVHDRRRLVAEQLTMLVDARAKWQQAEQETVIEMEQLARELDQREHAIDIREQQLIRADIRRRDEAYDLWQLRLHLETWQTKLTAFEMRWHTEREQLDTDLERRASIIVRREAELSEAFETWEKARKTERERLRCELELWTDDRKRLEAAAADFDRQMTELLAELSQHAARALAAEELVSHGIQDSGSNRVKRRLRVLRRRWESVFDRRAREVDQRENAVAAERAKLDEHFLALHGLLNEVVEREATLNNQAAKLLLKDSRIRELAAPETSQSAASASQTVELKNLRNEVERLANMLLDIDLPEPPEPKASELPWAIEEARDTERTASEPWAIEEAKNPEPTTTVLPFDTEVKAA
jgi:hypothetical protein